MESMDKRILLQKAQNYYQQGRLDLATNEYLKVISIDSYDLIALNTLGDIYSRQENLKQAFSMYQRVAKIYIEKAEYTKAIGIYNKITHIDQGNAIAYYELGKLYENEGVPEKALDCYIKALELVSPLDDSISDDIYERMTKLDPQNIELHLKLVNRFMTAGNKNQAKNELLTVISGYLDNDQIDKAEEQLKSLSEIADDASMLFANGLIAKKKEDYVSAEAYFVKVITKNSVFYDAYYQLAITRIAAGSEQRALIPLQQLLTKRTNFVPALEMLGDYYQKHNKIDIALEKYEKGIKSAMDASATIDVVRLLKKVLKIDPNNVPALERLRTLERASGPIRIEEVPKEVKEAASVAPGSGPAIVNMDIPSANVDREKKRKIADLLDEANKFRITAGLESKAEENYKIILSMDPNNITALNTLADSTMMIGDYDRAISYLKHLIKIYANRGKFGEALKSYERAIKLKPKDQELPLFKAEIEKRKKVLEQMSNLEISEEIEEVSPDLSTSLPKNFTEETPIPKQTPAQEESTPIVTVNETEMRKGGVEDMMDRVIEKQSEVIGTAPKDNFDLAVGYYQMGFYSKALYLFQIAAKSEDYYIASADMMAQCFLDQGLPEASIKWLNEALAKDNIDPAALLSLKFNLAKAYESLGDKHKAFEIYLEVYQMNARFKKVGKIIKKLKETLEPIGQKTVADEVNKDETTMETINELQSTPTNAPPVTEKKEEKPKKDDNEPPPQNPKISIL
jgi:tetratricopeptide (TPR) repeat protein